MAPALAREEIQSEIERMIIDAHNADQSELKPEIDRDHISHISTMMATKLMAQALPGVVRHVKAVHAIGRHTICEFEVSKGPRNETAYAALEAL